MPMEIVKEIAAAFGLGTVHNIGPGGGTANQNVVVETEGGRFYLKRRNPKYAAPHRVLYEYALAHYLSAKGIPTPVPRLSVDGICFVDRNGYVYQVTQAMEGCDWDERKLEHVEAAADMLAQFHVATRDFSCPYEKRLPRYDPPAEITEAIRLVARQTSNTGLIAYLYRTVERVEEELDDRAYASLPHFVIHGDYHPSNLKFGRNRVAGVFDLDWASEQPRIRDVADGVFYIASRRRTPLRGEDIFSLTEAPALDLDRARVFLQRYAEREPLAPEELKALPNLLRARWLYARTSGMHKVSADKQALLFLREIDAPLRWIDKHEGDLSSLVSSVSR